ncbi:hypothetical protein [Paracoccus hibiscisoli]|uniref:Uncharacterized protein n=1 Tax=Paracoccus hibiscisoli TaxID=2023261 RepID=A0A4U0QUK0_9RHOB|nr:hypothetical protein [Paracoccus hibiscisoli]TJZ85813.1 hypothetical protein FA740_05280 [Paracoccus hibiscisoli]
MTTPNRCYWVRDTADPGFEILIPMCWATVTAGPEFCTCAVPASRIEAAERGRSIAEQHVLRMRDRRVSDLDHQQQHWNQVRRLRARIAELEAALAERVEP